jgi:hypothetical protein
VTPSLQNEAPDSGAAHRWTVLGTVIGFLALVVAVLAWLLPQSATPDAGPTTTPKAAPTVAPTTALNAPAGTASVVYLDGGSFTPEAGADRLTTVPRAVRGQAGYASHPMAVRCPSNQTGDQASDVTFPLRGRYVQFDATVRPYYPPGGDQRSVTYVTALVGVRDNDGTLRVTEAGSQKRAGPAAPAPLTVAVDSAEKLTLRVQCDSPGGTIMLTDARLTSG